MHKSTKRFLVILFLLGILASVSSSNEFLLSLLALHAAILTIYAYAYAYSMNSGIYIFCQSRSYINSTTMEPLFFIVSCWLYAVLYSITMTIFLSYLINFIVSIFTQDLLNISESLFFCIGIWITGVSSIFILRYLYEIFSHQEYDLPEVF